MNAWLAITALLLYLLAAMVIVRALCICRIQDAHRALAMTFGGLSMMTCSFAFGIAAAIL